MTMKDPMNVIVCLCDQLRPFELGCYGNSAIQTPHIDRLARDGVRFETALTNNPVCMPARACLLSGQYSRTCMGELTNVGGDPPTPQRVHFGDSILPEDLRAAGYDTLLIGKWHIEPQPQTVGFEHSLHPLAIHRYRGQRYFRDGTLEDPVESFGPEYEMQEVERFLGSRSSKPFFLYYNISLPHNPIGPAEMPAEYHACYGKEDVRLRPNVWKSGAMAHDLAWFRTYLIWDHFWRVAEKDPWRPAQVGYPQSGAGEIPSDELPGDFDLRSLTATYYNAVRCIDDLVGRLLRSLEANGLIDNTLIVFASDHGDNLGSHHLFNKDCLFEESIRIPLIFHFPSRLRPHVNTRQLAQLIDIRPTILELAGITSPPGAQGVSLLPVLTWERPLVGEEQVFIETDTMHYGRNAIGIRTPTHIFGTFLDSQYVPSGEHWGFYDLREDPYQIRNLLNTGEQREMLDDLQRSLQRWSDTTPWLRDKHPSPSRG